MSQGEAPKPLKNWEFGDPVPHAWWPKVADTVIEARRCLAFASPWLVPDVGARDTRTDILLR